MAVSLTRFSVWAWGAKEKEPVSNGPGPTNLATELGFGFRESDIVKFPFVKGKKIGSSSRKVKRKWQSREQRKKIDREFDIVLVPSDGDCLSGSDESDSDWSVGWLEPHGPEFPRQDEDKDDSFAVLVPCYRRESKELVEESSKQFLRAIKNLPEEFNAAEGNNYVEQWLSSLLNC
ncbi:hypothetical protein SAY87_017157 [Trapa incisa]|uniref:Uncharacterized protein n=1 Tax=Trapa incisa TaxID=236973 RepID=A0AAN7QY60_9MYRT|nr:hypothetical protein SAY87_017157 [Trapa incisa]